MASLPCLKLVAWKSVLSFYGKLLLVCLAFQYLKLCLKLAFLSSKLERIFYRYSLFLLVETLSFGLGNFPIFCMQSIQFFHSFNSTHDIRVNKSVKMKKSNKKRYISNLNDNSTLTVQLGFFKAMEGAVIRRCKYHFTGQFVSCLLYS